MINCTSLLHKGILSGCLSVCLSVFVLCPRHGFVFKDRDVWFSLNDSKFFRGGVSVLKTINFAKLVELCPFSVITLIPDSYLTHGDLWDGIAHLHKNIFVEKMQIKLTAL